MSERLAAVVDFGSNSFHVLVARQRHGEWVAVERAKDKVQLGRGATGEALAADALERGLDSVARISQRLAAVPERRISAVGTYALRNARNRAAFTEAAERALRCPVRILSGAEEAELIFLGVSHVLTADVQRRLVVDIGGGSTELAVGASFFPECLTSTDLGCVTLTDRFFAPSIWTPSAFSAAKQHAVDALRGVCEALATHDWDDVVGTSGTIESIESVLLANGWSRRHITRDGLDRLQQAMLDRRWSAELGVPGLAPERVDIFAAGVAVLAAVFEALNIERMRYCQATLLDGVLYDLVGRRSAENVQQRTILNWQRRFGVDAAQAVRVKRCALGLLADVADAWSLDDAEASLLLGWAAELHEIGLDVSSRQPQRHAAYLIQNGDMPGLSSEQQRTLALLVRCCRGGVPIFAFAAYDDDGATRLQRLAVLLRLAVILQRSRRAHAEPVARAHGDAGRLRLELPAGWLQQHALSRAELDAERTRLEGLGLTLDVAADA